jgi:hypothetical protein
MTVAKYKEVKPRLNMSESPKERYGSKRDVLPMKMMIIIMYIPI